MDEPTTVQFSHLRCSVRTSKKQQAATILSDVSGCFEKGQLTAIIGPSGAGKSTLLNILAGRCKSFTGTVKFNDLLVQTSGRRKSVCHLAQSFELLPHLTVRESMLVSAKVKLASALCDVEMQTLINDVLDALSLVNVQHVQALNLSGGERKRLLMALELVGRASVLLFDEPTSGLDSQSSYTCVRLLQSIARKGRTVVCVIHQPSARLLEQFDALYVLAGGQCIFKGAVQLLLPFLREQGLECPQYHNPADHITEIASNLYGKECVARLALAANAEPVKDPGSGEQHALHEQLLTADESHEPVLVEMKELGSGEQLNGHSVHCTNGNVQSETERQCAVRRSFKIEFVVLLVRTVECIVREPMLTSLRFIAHLAVGLLVGALYFGVGDDKAKTFESAASIFFSCVLLMFTSMMPTILTFPLELEVLSREYFNRWYRLGTYYAAKAVADVPFQIVFTMLYAAIVYFMTKQPLDVHRFLLYLLFLVLTSLVAQSLGLLIGAAASLQVAVFLGPATAIPILLFSGFFITFGKIPVYLRWCTYLSYVRYSFEGSLVAVYGFRNDSSTVLNSTTVLDTFEVDEDFIRVDILMLAIYFALFRVLGYFVLRRRVM